ncbi:MAG: DUF4082 domain-containing protein [Melioribacteraceae bacterium]|nr:DUF4082 domain-containing protein [Melioribacteraceae bacterium]
MKKEQRISYILLAFFTFFLFSGIIYSQNTIFTNQVPASTGNDSDYELGTKFSSDLLANVNAIRFYKAAGETGSHIGKIWDNSGTLIASVSFTNETASGWQSMNLPSSLLIQPNTVYTVSVNSNVIYPITQNELASQLSNSFLHTVVGNNGVFNENPGSFPNQSYNNSNYYVDISASSLNTIFTTQLPTQGTFNDGPYEMGVKFTTSQVAKVKMLSYYKTAGESGAHIGNLWNSTGTLLASAQFSSEAGIGWQISDPVDFYIYPGNVYMASVNSNTEYGAEGANSLLNSVTNGILSTVADGNNGVFSGTPGTAGIFPTNSFNHNNYLRDLVVEPVYTPAIPSALSPLNNSAGVSIEPILSWSPVPYAISYNLQVSTDQNFATFIVNETGLTNTTYSLGTLDNATTYYWRVSSVGELSLTNGFSSNFSFTTVNSVAITLSYPLNAVELFNLTPTLSWFMPMGGTWKYDLFLSTTANFLAPQIISNISSTSQVINNLVPGTLYYWKVRVKTTTGVVVTYSQVGTFKSFGKAVKPVASYPVGNPVLNTYVPTLYWYLNTASTGLTYEVEVREGLPTALTGVATHSNINAQNLTVTLLPGKQYSWQVRSKSGSVYSDWSAPVSFRTIALPTVIVPTPSWPLGNAIVYSNSPTLYWYLGAASTGLTYQVEFVEGFATAFTGTPSIMNINALSVALSNLNAGAEYKWRVRSTDGTNFSNWSVAATFKTIAPASVNPVVPYPSFPIGGQLVYSSATSLNWYLMTSSAGYTFDVEYSTSALTGTPTVTGINALNYNLTPLTAGATYKWKVRSKLNGVYSAWSAEQTFVTVNSTPIAAKPIASWPIGGATVYSNSPNLSWFLNSGSAGLTYQLLVANNSGFTGAAVHNPAVNQFQLSGLTSGTTYYWKVRSYDGSVYSAYSDVATFVTASSNASVVPIPASPSGGVEIENIPMLSWFLPTASEPVTYELQYSKDSEMSNPIQIETENANATLSNLNAGETYFWRVRSKSNNGEYSQYSEVAEFKSGGVTSAEEIVEIPSAYELKQNYPNPFNPTTILEVSIAETGFFSLDVYNSLGEKVTNIVSKNLDRGVHKYTFDASNLSSGIYFYRLTGNNVNLIKKMVLIR